MPTLIGEIRRLQVQRSPLKMGEKPNRTYVTAPLLAVPALRASADGVTGLTADGEILDVHHRGHPESRNDGGANGISIGFTAHYDAMRSRYGPHMTLGCAGENVIVESGRPIGIDAAAEGFVVRAGDGRVKCRLGSVTIARPCKPFSGYALGGMRVDSATLKATLQFLDGGTRGFYCGIVPMPGAAAEVILAPGDLVELAG
ncbi:MAG TPA: hypothetical protein VJ992_15510 [Gemmatimonadales bacterium]|jgi:hypothetical protein|nr:hypothetical protein [Gemmatimonadales bacterium]